MIILLGSRNDVIRSVKGIFNYFLLNVNIKLLNYFWKKVKGY